MQDDWCWGLCGLPQTVRQGTMVGTCLNGEKNWQIEELIWKILVRCCLCQQIWKVISNCKNENSVFNFVNCFLLIFYKIKCYIKFRSLFQIVSCKRLRNHNVISYVPMFNLGVVERHTWQLDLVKVTYSTNVCHIL